MMNNAMTDGTEPVLRAVGITKQYGPVAALRGVDLNVYPNEVIGLVGDNGAGKSTLVNILSGALPPTGGRIEIGGEAVSFSSPADARAAGIETVYQDLALALNVSIASNIFLGREPTRRGPLRLLSWVDKKAMEREAEAALDRFGIRLGSLSKRAGQLSGGQRQAVAVARAVAWGSRVIFMDEPTAALGVEQQQHVLDMVRDVKAQGIPVVLISHNIDQVHAVCDRVVVLRRGTAVADLRTGEVDPQTIVMWITGAITGEQAA
jgi:ABC-type sugar transport system ATPase subunit